MFCASTAAGQMIAANDRITIAAGRTLLTLRISPSIKNTPVKSGFPLAFGEIVLYKPALPRLTHAVLLQAEKHQNLTGAFIQRLERLADQSAWPVNWRASKIERL